MSENDFNKIETSVTESPVNNEDSFFEGLEEFGSTSNDEITLEDETITLSEDYTGFAKGFPDWVLHPPKDIR